MDFITNCAFLVVNCGTMATETEYEKPKVKRVGAVGGLIGVGTSYVRQELGS